MIAWLDLPSNRRKLYQALHPNPAAKFLPLMRELLKKECQYRAEQTNDGEFFENLYWVALFLYQIGTLDDVMPMWRAKHINMDTGCGFDVQFLVGQGVGRTLSFLSSLNEDEAKSAHQYISECQAAGDFDELDQWLQHRINYFA